MTVRLTPSELSFLIESVKQRRTRLKRAIGCHPWKGSKSLMAPHRARGHQMNRLIAKLAAARKGNR